MFLSPLRWINSSDLQQKGQDVAEDEDVEAGTASAGAATSEVEAVAVAPTTMEIVELTRFHFIFYLRNEN